MKRELEGYLKRTPIASEADLPMSDNGTCAWLANGKRCRFPGSITNSTLGSDRWYCRFHFMLKHGSTGAEVVEQSQGYTPDRYNEMYAPAAIDKLSPSA